MAARRHKMRNILALIAMLAIGVHAQDQTIDGKLTVTGQGVANAGTVNLNSVDPFIRFNVTNGGTDTKKYDIRAVSNGANYEFLSFRKVNDANTTFTELMAIANNGDVLIAPAASVGQTPKLKLYGYPTGGSLTALEMYIGGVDTAKFTGVGYYHFEGKMVRIKGASGEVGETMLELQHSRNTAGDAWGISFANPIWGGKARIRAINANAGNGQGALQLQTVSATIVDGAYEWNTGLYMDSAGKIGIGTTSPGAELVVGRSWDNNATLRIGKHSTTYGFAYFDAAAATSFFLGNAWASDSSKLVLQTTPTSGTPQDRLTIDGTGRVGIGMTPASDAKLSISQSGGTIKLGYTGASHPWNNNNLGLLTDHNIGLVGQWSSLNVPFAHGTADNTRAWWMLGRSSGNDNQFTLQMRPGSNGANYDIIKVTGAGNAGQEYIDVLSFHTSYGAERMRIDTNGNVGIGCIPGSYKLDVRLPKYGFANFETSESGYGGVRIADQNQPVLQFTSGTKLQQIYGGNDLCIRNYVSAGSILFYTNSTEAMRIDSTGNVGVGTTTPGAKLEIFKPVVGAGLASDSAIALRYNSTTVYGRHFMDANGQYFIYAPNNGVSGGNLSLWADTGIYFRTAGTVNDGIRMMIKNNGNVGVGTTAPVAKLQIGDNTKTDLQTIYLQNSSALFRMGIAGGGSDIISTAAAGDAVISNVSAKGLIFGTNNIERMRIKDDGSIGIATSSTTIFNNPELDVKLMINGDAAIHEGKKLVFSQHYRDHGFITYDNTDIMTARLRYHSYYGHRFSDSAGTQVVIRQGGNVGIGTTTPGSKLAVNGNLRLSSVTAGTRYVLLGEDSETDSGTGKLVVQAGAGSSGYGGAINLFAHSHATKAGWVTAGLSANANAKFTVNTQGLAGGTDVFTVQADGKVGIGTSTPSHMLHVFGSGKYAEIYAESNMAAGMGMVSAKADTDGVVQIAKFGSTRAGTTFGQSNANAAWIGTTTTATVHPSSLLVGTFSSQPMVLGTNNQSRIHIAADGNVGIGIAPDATHKLTVDGKVRAEEIIVEVIEPADYVFEKDYKLRSLAEVEQHVAKHKHLPGIPSGKEIKKNGLSMGEMMNKQLEKIEELTLYAIAQSKELRAKGEELEAQGKKLAKKDKEVEELKKRLERIEKLLERR